MCVEYKRKPKELNFLISGEIDEFSAPKTRAALDKIIDENTDVGSVVFDLTNVGFMDSTGIGMLIGRYKKLQKFGIPVYISGTSASVEKVFSLSGIYKLMPKK